MSIFGASTDYEQDENYRLRRRVRELELYISALVISAPRHLLYIEPIAVALAGEGKLVSQKLQGGDRECIYWVREESR